MLQPSLVDVEGFDCPALIASLHAPDRGKVVDDCLCGRGRWVRGFDGIGRIEEKLWSVLSVTVGLVELALDISDEFVGVDMLT